jgi:hypothetical protein
MAVLLNFLRRVALQPSYDAVQNLQRRRRINCREFGSSAALTLVIASEAKQSNLPLWFWIASLRSQ